MAGGRRRRPRGGYELIPERSGGNAGPWIVGGLLIVLALAWLGAAGWVFARRPLPQDPLAILNMVALVSAPLVLIACSG